LPFGELERGTRSSDLSFGSIPLGLDAAYAVSRIISIGAFGVYAPSVPTLCAAASDCIASVGSDARLGLLVRARVPTSGQVLPVLEGGVGYEWTTRRLVDNGAESTRSFSGPILFRAAVIPTFRREASRFEFGIPIGMAFGVAARSELESPGVHLESHADGRGVHGSVDLGIRLSWWL
jgi:hypothetical protein